MAMAAPVAALLPGGDRLHLQHGPIDLVIGADPLKAGGREAAFRAAAARFDGLLEELVAELPLLRSELRPGAAPPEGAVARRMHAAAMPFSGDHFLTRMIAVAGSVADEVLAAMCAAVPLRRAYVNDGGDIALHLGAGESFTTAMAGLDGSDLGRVTLNAGDGIGGMATSGSGGRSHSFGIADSVTVLARSAAAADAAATLVANAVDLPGHPAIRRTPARELQPDSDLGDRPVVTAVGTLSPGDCRAALGAGLKLAEAMAARGLIAGAALFLRGEKELVGACHRNDRRLEVTGHDKA